MIDTILFPTDGSDGALAALDHVLDIAATHDATVHVLNVADTAHYSYVQTQGEILDVLVEEGEHVVRDAADEARARNVSTITDVRQGIPHEIINEYATSEDVDLVVMPTQGRTGLERFLIGSTTERVVRGADVPVLTFRPTDVDLGYPYRNVLVPTDGSESASGALELGCDFVTSTGTNLHILTVISSESLGIDVRSDVQMRPMEERAANILENATSVASERGVKSVTEAVEYGVSIRKTIRSYVETHEIDLVAVGTHGRTGVDRYILGSVTEYLIRTSPVPVLTVRV